MDNYCHAQLLIWGAQSV